MDKDSADVRVEPRETKCGACNGNGWRAVRNPRLGPGIYEVDCDQCGAFGWVVSEPESRP